MRRELLRSGRYLQRPVVCGPGQPAFTRTWSSERGLRDKFGRWPGGAFVVGHVHLQQTLLDQLSTAWCDAANLYVVGGPADLMRALIPLPKLTRIRRRPHWMVAPAVDRQLSTIPGFRPELAGVDRGNIRRFSAILIATHP
jgi:hypothetical protein